MAVLGPTPTFAQFVADARRAMAAPRRAVRRGSGRSAASSDLVHRLELIDHAASIACSQRKPRSGQLPVELARSSNRAVPADAIAVCVGMALGSAACAGLERLLCGPGVAYRRLIVGAAVKTRASRPEMRNARWRNFCTSSRGIVRRARPGRRRARAQRGHGAPIHSSARPAPWSATRGSAWAEAGLRHEMVFVAWDRIRACSPRRCRRGPARPPSLKLRSSCERGADQFVDDFRRHVRPSQLIGPELEGGMTDMCFAFISRDQRRVPRLMFHPAWCARGCRRRPPARRERHRGWSDGRAPVCPGHEFLPRPRAPLRST